MSHRYRSILLSYQSWFSHSETCDHCHFTLVSDDFHQETQLDCPCYLEFELSLILHSIFARSDQNLKAELSDAKVYHCEADVSLSALLSLDHHFCLLDNSTQYARLDRRYFLLTNQETENHGKIISIFVCLMLPLPSFAKVIRIAKIIIAY